FDVGHGRRFPYRPGRSTDQYNSIGLGKDDPPLARLPADHARARLGDPALPGSSFEPALGDAPDRDLEGILDGGLAEGLAAPVREREAPVDLGLLLVLALRREERLELVPRVDGPGVLVPVGEGPGEEAALDLLEDLDGPPHELGPGHAGLVPGGPIAP